MFQVHIDEQILNILTLTGIALYAGFIICNICLFTLWFFLSTLILQLRLNLLIVYIGSQEYLILQKLGLWLF